MLSAIGSAQAVNIANPVNRNHWLARYLQFWCIGLPGIEGDLVREPIRLNTGTLTNMNSGTSGWRGNRRPGALGKCLEFDGSDDYATWTLPNAVLGNPLAGGAAYSIALWARRLSGTGLKGMFNWQDVGNNYAICYWDNAANGLSFQRSGGGTSGTKPAAAITETNWNHFVFTAAGTGTAVPKLYLNGFDAGTSANPGYGDAVTNALNIGRGTNSTYCSNMQSDDVMLISRELSANEALQLYQSSRTGHPGLINRLPTPPGKAGSAAAFKAAWARGSNQLISPGAI